MLQVRFLFSLVLVVAVVYSTVKAKVSVKYMHLKSDVMNEITRIENLERVQEKILTEMENLKHSLKDQGRDTVILKYKNNDGSEKTLSFSKDITTVAGLPVYPYGVRNEMAKVIEEVIQYNGKVYFICSHQNYIPVYDSQTLAPLFNLSLPTTNCKISSSYAVLNSKEGAIYLMLSYHTRKCQSALRAGVKIWKMSTFETKWMPLQISTNEQIRFMGPSNDGQMLFASKSHIYIVDPSGTVTRNLKYYLPAEFQNSTSRRIIQTRRGSILIPGSDSIAQFDSNGQYIDSFARGLIKPTGDTIRGRIGEISEGPGDLILISDPESKRVLTLDLTKDTLSEFLTGLQYPIAFSYEQKSQNIIVVWRM